MKKHISMIHHFRKLHILKEHIFTVFVSLIIGQSVVIVLFFSIFILMLIGCVPQLHSQRLGDRFLHYHPIKEYSIEYGQTEWLAGFSAQASFERYTASAGEQTWRHFTFVGADIFRQGNTWALSILSTIEMVANDSSDISFNPRSIWWEEGLVASGQATDNLAWQAGYIHRCKHDIDSYEVGSQRVLIYSGPTARLFYRLNENLESVLGVNYFMVARDYREGINTRSSPDLEQLSWSVIAGLRGEIPLSESGRTVLTYNGYYNAHVYRGNASLVNAGKTLYADAGVQAGVEWRNKARFRLFVTWETLADTHISVLPKSHSAIRMGFLLGNIQ